jgi:hypothetical protein
MWPLASNTQHYHRLFGYCDADSDGLSTQDASEAEAGT